MKISGIELSWFRGAAESAALNTLDRSIAVYGANGAGKSCFVDAIEYTLRDGRIEHLAHEYSGKNQERAVLNTHQPKGSEAHVVITLADGADVTVSIAENGANSSVIGGETDFTVLDCARTVLRQDEVSHFIHSTKGQKYSVLLPLLGLADLEIAAENFRQLCKEVRKMSGAVSAAATLKSAQSQLKRVYNGEAPSDSEGAVVELCQRFVSDSHEHAFKTCSKLVKASIDAQLDDATELQKQQLAVERLGSKDLRSAVEEVKTAATGLAAVADHAVQNQLDALRATKAYIELDESEQVVCPSCGTEFPRSELVEHVDSELGTLVAAKGKLEEYRHHVGELVRVARSIVAECQSAEIVRWSEQADDSSVEAAIAAAGAFEVPGREIDAEAIKSIRDALGPAVVAAAASSSFLPPPAAELARAKERLSAATNLLEAEEQVSQARVGGRIADQVEAMEAGIREEIKRRSKGIVAEISKDIQRMWAILHPGEPIEDVRLHIPTESAKAIDIALKFYGKELTSPRLTLSEGYRNSLGLCVFLAMASRYGEGNTPIVLDDVIVSLDRGHRGMVVTLLETEFPDRQILLFTHDRDWHTDLRQQLDGKRWTFRSLLPYRNPKEGIRWSERTGTFNDARAYLDPRPDTAANEARKIMDVELAVYSEGLNLELPFARGARNDRRTAHDFLRALISVGKKSLQTKDNGSYQPNEAAVEALKAADRLLLTWANRGSHTEDVTESEATRLIDVCEEAILAFECKSCGQPVTYAEDKSGRKQCSCGGLRWK